MKVSGLPVAASPNGSEEIPVVQTVGGVKSLVQMSATQLAQAGTRPTPADLQAAIIAALQKGTGINFVVDQVAGTVTISVDTNALATVTALNNGLGGKQDKNANLTALAGLALAGNSGKVVKVNATGDGLILDVDLQSQAVGTGINDGTYGDVIVSGNGTKMSVKLAADSIYGAAWANDLTPATRSAVYAKIEALNGTIGQKVSTNTIGVANGVASLDATGKVPAGQLPSYVDDVLEFDTAAAFPNPGETGKIYVARDTGRQSRWTGTAYVELTASPGTSDAVPEGSRNLYYTDARVRGAAATGLVQTVGAPAATDNVITVLGKLWRQSFRALTSADMPSSVPIVGGDGGMEVGQYVDFHLPNTNDGRDYAGRISVFANGGGFGFSLAANALLVGGTQMASLNDIAGKFDKSGGAIGGTINVSGNVYCTDVHADRGDGTGVIYFGAEANAHYLYWDGGTYHLTNGRTEMHGDAQVDGALNVSGNITASSDRRLKSDIRPLENAAAIVGALNGYRFTMHGAPSVGVIAQEVEAVLPELVATDQDGMLSVDYGKLTAVLIEAVKTLTGRVADLEARLAA